MRAYDRGISRAAEICRKFTRTVSRLTISLSTILDIVKQFNITAIKSCARLLAFAWPAALAWAQAAPEPATQAAPVVVRASVAPDASSAAWSLSGPDAADAWDALNGSVPNFHASEGGAGGFGSLFALRGLANTPYFSEPAVTVYFEDIPLPSGFTYPSGLAGFTAANVYYGPQGTRFGRATDGGVMVFSAGDLPPGGEAALAAGSDRERRGAWLERAASGDGGVQLTAAAAYGAREGYVTNDLLGRRVDGQEEASLFARARWRPKPPVRVALEILGQRERDGAQPLVPLGGPLYDVSRAQEGRTDLDGQGAALRADLDIGAGTLRSVTSATAWALNPYDNFLVLPPPLQSAIFQRQNAWNEELQFEADPRAAITGRAGIWLSRATTRNFTDRQIPGLFPIEASGFDQRSSAGAAFAEISAQLDPAWRLTAGLRAETTQKQFTRREQVPVPGLVFTGEGRYGAALPRLALDWTGAGGRGAEASVGAGLRPGGFSSFTDNPGLIPFAAERVMAYALAWTWAPPHASAALAIRAFDEEIRNDQIERSFTAADYFVATAARARARGVEAEGRWHPLAGLTASFAAGWTDAVLSQYRAPVSGQDLSGNAAPDIPLFTAQLEVGYRGRSGWFVSGRLADTGRIYYDELESAAFEQAAVATAAARAGYAAARWSVALEAKNLTQARYYQLIVPGVGSGVPGNPRTLEAETSLTW
ncbi:MAG TPA: TonB-dependent receptor [Opitutaceae bacterium]|nr:TonB-dependent receptor [Opitutaceae bacterium]